MTIRKAAPRAKRRWATLAGIVGTLVLMLGSVALATNVGGFEIDADSSASGQTMRAYYSGNDPAGNGDDWAQGATHEGAFLASALGLNPITGCYGSDISVNPDISGAAGVICDGTSDSGFRTFEPEQSIVSPAGKTPDDIWSIKPGNNTPKNDITHGYTLIREFDSPCDVDTDADDLLVMVGGERLNNEGDSFWGFELNKVAPGGFSNLLTNNGASFSMNFNRTLGDVLLSVSLQKGGTQPTIEVFSVNGFNADNSANFGQSASACAGQPISAGATNGSFDAKAPGWNVLVCDPSDTKNTNSCRLVNGAGTAPNNAGDTNVPERDFIEAAIDLTQFGIAPACFNNVLFTSRSSSSITADLKDVGGGSVPLCGSDTVTEVHDADHNDITNDTLLLPGDVHDKAIVTATSFGDGALADPTGNVTFTLYNNSDCDPGDEDANVISTDTKSLAVDAAPNDGTASVESSTSTLEAGSYGYVAAYLGSTTYPGSVGDCEPFTLALRDSQIVTNIHNADHEDITGATDITQGTEIHDKAFVDESGSTGGPTPTGTVTFTLYNNDECDPGEEDENIVGTEDVELNGDGEAETTPFTPEPGALSFSASYEGDDVYNASGDALCEPLTVIQPSTILDKDAAIDSISVVVTYSYKEKNDGSTDLTMPAGGYVEDDQCSDVTIVGDDGDNVLEPDDPDFEDWSGDTNDDGILSPGETWNFECTTTISATTTNVAIGHGIDPVGLDVTFCTEEEEEDPPTDVRCDGDERDSTTVTINVSVTDNGKDVLFP